MSTERPTKTINIAAALHKQLKVVAAQEDKTVQQVVEELIASSLGLERD
jgi:hypothetical protein